MAADQRTLAHYDARAPEETARYESADMGRLHRLLGVALDRGAKILELGCGSGRDAAYLLSLGHDVTATDGSPTMLAEAERLHPSLGGRLRHLVFPGPFPFADASFDAVLAVATLMHLEEPAIEEVLREAARVLRGSGVLVFSVPGRRPDVGAGGRDLKGRLFTLLPELRWMELCGRAGLAVESRCTSTDRLGRDGVEWWTFVARPAPRR
jgi:SAM-dependent methyltransferase